MADGGAILNLIAICIIQSCCVILPYLSPIATRPYAHTRSLCGCRLACNGIKKTGRARMVPGESYSMVVAWGWSKGQGDEVELGGDRGKVGLAVRSSSRSRS